MNGARRFAVYLLVLLGTLLWGVVAVLGTHLLLYEAPRIVHSVRSPSPEEECNRLHPGMKLAEVWAIVARRTEPYDEGLSGNKAFFSRTGFTCVLEIDPRTEQVLKVSGERLNFRISE